MLSSESDIKTMLLIFLVPNVLTPEIESNHNESASEKDSQEFKHAPQGHKARVQERTEDTLFFKINKYRMLGSSMNA